MPLDAPAWVGWIMGAGLVAGALWQIGRVVTSIAGWVEARVRNVVREELEPIRAEVECNHGESLKDSVVDLVAWAHHHDATYWKDGR